MNGQTYWTSVPIAEIIPAIRWKRLEILGAFLRAHNHQADWHQGLTSPMAISCLARPKHHWTTIIPASGMKADESTHLIVYIKDKTRSGCGLVLHMGALPLCFTVIVFIRQFLSSGVGLKASTKRLLDVSLTGEWVC